MAKGRARPPTSTDQPTHLSAAPTATELDSGGGPVPYRAELESFFGADLSGMSVSTGADLGGLEASAAQAGSGATFASANPAKRQIAHEAAHYVQRTGAGTSGPGVSTPGAPAEQQAEAAAEAFVAGGTAPVLDAAPPAIARDGETGTALEQLNQASQGDWIGNVDEGRCLTLINSLSEAERTTARGDNGLMRRLADAFNGNEMLQAVNALTFELKWKAYWIQQAGGLGDIGPVQWQVLMASPAPQVREFLGWTELFRACIPFLGTTPLLVFSAIRGTPDWTSLLASSDGLASWMVLSCTPQQLVDEVGGPTVDDASLPTVMTRIGSVRAWRDTIPNLPRAGGMPVTTRAALKRMKAHFDVATAKLAFEVRFGHSLTGRTEKTDTPGTESNFIDMLTGNETEVDWALPEIITVWDQLDVLPDQDVTGNTVLRSLQAIRHGWAGGFWASPDIQITQGQGNPAGLQHTIRHEIGHSVHDGPLNGAVNSWCQNDIGFWYLGSKEQGVRDLVGALGGWPATYNDSAGTAQPFAETQQNRIVELLIAHSGGTRALNATGPALPNAATPATDDDRYWAAMDPKIQSCFALSANAWYNNHSAWPVGAQGRMFYNHYYEKAYRFSPLAEQTVVATGDNYTAMSEGEFFANCYAEYFKDPAGYADHSLWGGALPAPVKNFMQRAVLEHQPYSAGSYAPAAPAAGPAAAGTGAAPAPAAAGSAG